MRVNKTIKKIASVGVAVGMVGATLMGAAMAADLSEYPYMFIEDGNFNGLLVVGADARAEDIIGITNIATSLQTVSVKTTVVSSGAGSSSDRVTVTDGVELCDRDLFVGQAISGCEASVDDAELPDLLGDDIYHDAEGDNDNDERYTQEVLFQTNVTGVFKFDQDDDDAPVADTYVFIDDSNAYFYNYTLKFDDRADYDNTSSTTAADDIEGTTLTIQGREYTITDVKVSSGQLSEIEMQAGETVVWMSEGETVDRTVDGVSHSIEMIDVTGDATESTGSCGFKIDGTTAWIDVDDTDTINGVTIGVIDAKAVNIEAQDQDVCKVVIGAHEIKLVDTDELEINDEDVDGTYCEISEKTTASEGRWSGFSISFAPDLDEVYLGPGDEYIDPILGNFKFVFGGVNTGGIETFEWVTGSTSGYLRFSNEDGREVEIPLCADENSPGYDSSEASNEPVYLGDDAPTTSDNNEDKALYLEGEVCSGSSSDVSNCVGAMFLVITSTTNEAHIVEITNIDTNDNQMDFRDLTYGTEDKDLDYTNGTDMGFALSGGVGTINLSVDESAGIINFTSTGTASGATIETLEEASLAILNSDLVNQTYEGWNFSEGNDGDINVYLSDYTVYAVYDDSDDSTIEFNHTTLSTTDGYGWADESSDNDDFVKFYTLKGSLITYDQEDKQSLVIEHPHDAVYAEVYIAPTDADTLEVADEGAVSEEVQKISVNAVKLDSEVTSVTDKNIVAVGGPCANSVVAELMGNPAECETSLGISSGQALIKLYENGDYVAVVIAGQDAMDTRLACQIMSNWDDYSLTGDEMVATTVSESSLSVTAQ